MYESREKQIAEIRSRIASLRSRLEAGNSSTKIPSTPSKHVVEATTKEEKLSSETVEKRREMDALKAKLMGNKK